jgi:hypothetical protein
MSTLPVWLRVALFTFGATGSWFFIYRYMRTYRWWSTALGRHMIAFSAIVGAWFTYIPIVLIWPQIPGRNAIGTVLIVVLVLTVWWRVWMFERLRRAVRKENRTVTNPVQRALGRRAPKNAPALKLGNFLTGTIPVHPVSVDHFAEVADWGLYGNDRFGVCGPTSVANQRKLITRYLGGVEQSPSQDDVFDLYRRSGNPNFDPATGVDDNGVDMQTMLEAVHAGGIGGTKCLGFAKVDVTNLDEMRAAIAIFGSLLLGVNLEVAQQAQKRLWDYAPSSEWGGHAVLNGRYTSAKTGADLAVVTWAEVVGLTDAFELHQVEEAWVVIWPEHLGTTEFEQAVDQAALAADYLALTGRPFPEPAPGPVPVPADAADRALAQVLRPWVTKRHVGENRRVANVAKTWLIDKEL